MIDAGKRDVLGVMVNAIDYDSCLDRIVSAAHAGEPMAVTALAVHGVMTGVDDPEHRTRLNRLDIVTPDGQPVRWALRWLHGISLPDRVYGPALSWKLYERAAAEGLPVYFYGSTQEVLDDLVRELRARVPGLRIAGTLPSRFARVDREEAVEIARSIRESGARICFVGLGCPRQEVFAYELRDALSMPVLAVGAAFDYHAGHAVEPSATIQRLGLQWAHRLAHDFRRLWRRYLLLNPRYLTLVGLQRAAVRRMPNEPGREPAHVGYA